MRGSIVGRNNHYSVVVDMGKDPITGKRHQQWISVKGNKKAAERQLPKILTQLQEGTFVKSTKLTVREYFTQWLKDSAFPNMTPRTYEGYEFIINKHIIPALGHVPVTELKPYNIQRLCGDKQAAGTYRTAQYVYNTLNKVMESAVKMDILMRNPVSAIEPPKVPRHDMKTLNESEFHLFLEYAKSTPYYALFYLALFSGMRRSELLALKWADVDLLLCQLSVKRTMYVLRYGTYRGQIIFKQPKTAKSRRLIALSPSTAIVLKEYLQAQQQLRRSLELAPVTDDDLVFCHFDGKPLLPDSVSHAWMKMVRRAGFRGVRFHDARHSHASLMLKQGTHPKIVQERLGHNSIETTLDTYSHVVPGLQEAAAVRFDDMFIREAITTVQKISVSNLLAK